jgi:hypothetical protein
MTRHPLERVARCEVMSGLSAVHQRLSIGSVVDDLLLVAACSLPSDWAVRIRSLSLRYTEEARTRKNAEPALANSAFHFFVARRRNHTWTTALTVPDRGAGGVAHRRARLRRH